MKQLLPCVGMLSVLVAFEPAVAADLKVPAPVAVAQQTPASNWSGGQIGGNGGGSISNNSFVEPGTYLCSAGTFIRIDLL